MAKIANCIKCSVTLLFLAIIFTTNIIFLFCTFHGNRQRVDSFFIFEITDFQINYLVFSTVFNLYFYIVLVRYY